MAKAAERLDELEKAAAELDQEALSAVGASVRGLIKKRDTEHNKAITALAHQALKNALKPFPEFAREAVKEEFAKRLSEAGERGYSKGMRLRSGFIGGPDDSESPVTVTDLLEDIKESK